MTREVDAGAWVRERACERRIDHLRAIAGDAPDESEVFTSRAPGYLGGVGIGRFSVDESEPMQRRYLARAFAHVDPRVTEASELGDLCEPWPMHDDPDAIIWRLKVDRFGEPNIAATATGYLTVRFDTVRRTFSASMLWRDREQPYGDVFAKTTALDLRTQAGVLSLLRKAHAWGAREWLAEREALDAARVESRRRREDRLADEIANLP